MRPRASVRLTPSGRSYEALPRRSAYPRSVELFLLMASVRTDSAHPNLEHAETQRSVQMTQHVVNASRTHAPPFCAARDSCIDHPTPKRELRIRQVPRRSTTAHAPVRRCFLAVCRLRIVMRRILATSVIAIASTPNIGSSQQLS
jgi:hypothetical protein